MKVSISERKIYDKVIAQFKMCNTFSSSMSFENWLQNKDLYFHYPESASIFNGSETQAKRRLLSMFRNNFELEVESAQQGFEVTVRVNGGKVLDFKDDENRRVAIGQDGNMVTIHTRVIDGVKETYVQEHPPKKMVGLIFEHTNAGFPSH